MRSETSAGRTSGRPRYEGAPARQDGRTGRPSLAPVDGTASTRGRLLDAALAVLARTGLQGLALEDVAREAGMSRQTLYRYFGSRDALVSAVVVREEERFIALIEAAAAAHSDLGAALEAAIGEALRLARAHPLLDRLLASEPEALLPLLLTGAGPVLPAARPVIERLLADRLPENGGPSLHRAADALTRLLISYVANPPDDAPAVVARDLAALLLPGVRSGAPAPSGRVREDRADRTGK